MRIAIAARNVGDGRERIAAPASRVRARDGQFANRRSVMQIAKIDQREPVPVDDYVVIVGIAVNYAVRQRTTMPISSITSSSTNGRAVFRRTVRHSS